MLMGEGCEDAAAHAEVGNVHVRAFLGVVEAKGEFPKVVDVHGRWFSSGGPDDTQFYPSCSASPTMMPSGPRM